MINIAHRSLRLPRFLLSLGFGDGLRDLPIAQDTLPYNPKTSLSRYLDEHWQDEDVSAADITVDELALIHR